MNPADFLTSLDLAAMETEFFKLLETLVSFNTERRPAEPGAPFGAETALALDRLLKIAEDDGFRVGNLDHYCGWIDYGDGDEIVAAVCHLDIVPAGNPADWTTPAFQLVRLADRIVGRGVIDDKGPLVLVYQLMRELKRRDVKFRHRLRLIVGCAEETGCDCLKHYLAAGEPVPRYAITPDGDYPVVCGECGIMHFTLSRNYHSGENRLKLTSGSVINAVPALAEAECDGKKYTAIGKSAHASTPELGENALVKLCAELDGKIASDFPSLVRRLNRDDMNLALEDKLSRLTLVPSLAGVNESRAEVKCDVRFPVTMRSPEILARIKNAVNGSGYELKIDFIDEPLYFDPGTPFIRALLNAYETAVGVSGAKARVIGGGTYAKHLPNTVAFGCMFPERGTHAHEANECWMLDEIKLNFQILSRALYALDTLE